ncbi:MAG: sugar kinase [Octadecabacter sp.]|nr:sugar kinase [Octadecabacter sp.]
MSLGKGQGLTPDLSSIRRVACLGEVMIEMTDDGQDRPRLGVAGDTYNTSVYLRRLLKRADVSVSYITALGRDRFSNKILDTLSQHDIETSHVEIRDGRVPGIYMVETAPDGERSFSYWRSESAARTLFQKPCKIGLGLLRDFDLVFLSGISLAILQPDVRKELLSALAVFRAEGGIVVYDSNHRPRLWESEALARETNMTIWAQTDIALPSVDDEMALFDESDERQVLDRLTAAGATYGAIKRGPKGPKALGYNDIDQDYTAVENVIDTTAAGDSFNAGFLAGLIGGQSLKDALLQGHNLSAKVILQRGAIVDFD